MLFLNNYMKRILSLFCILISTAASARIIDEPSCRKIASDVLGRTGENVALELVRTGGFSNSSADRPEYYIYNNAAGKGFVIVSADESVPPVLGHSSDRSYTEDNLPENFVSWMQMWDKIISANRKAGVDSWKSKYNVSYSALPSEYLLETALWGQSAPYNNLCPKEGTQRCVTGCTATATCIVMRYHKWPDAGVGNLPSYTYTMDSGKKNTVEGIELGEAYDWDNMPLKYTSGATSQQKKAVALLMQHVGVMIKSMYNAGGTGAYPDDVPVGLVEHMKYDRSTDIFGACNYTAAVWIEKLKASISSNYPVIYSGYSATSGGHCFVLDGYNAKNEMRINFGWDGAMNGYYAFPDFSEFTIGHAATFNAHKDEGGLSPDSIEITNSGMSSSTTNFRAGVKFNVSVSYISNYGYDPFNGTIALAKADSKDNVQEIISSQPLNLKSSYRMTVQFNDCVFSKKAEIGEKLIVIYRSDRTPEWTEVPFDRESNIKGELPLADPYSTEEKTTFKYDVASATATISTKSGVDMSLLDESGNPIKDGVAVNNSTMTISANKLKEGIYVVVLSKDDEYKELKVKLGTKK